MDTRNFGDILTQMQKTFECSICLELLSNPVSTKCDHQFCSFCITKFLQSKRSVPCPLCKKPVTKRGIQERSELSIVINNVKQLIAAYEADTKETFTPSKTYREILPTTHNRKANRKKASDRQVKTTTQTPDCQNVDLCHGETGSSSVPVGEGTGLHSHVTDSVPRTRSRRRSQIVCSLADTVVSMAAEEPSIRQSNGDSPDINGHRHPGRKRKLSFQSVISDNDDKSIVGQIEKLNNNFDQHGVHKRAQGDKDNEHPVSSADILCYLEEGSCGAVQDVISANGNENYEHVISASGWEVNSKQEPADSNQKCETIPQSANITPCKNMNNKKSVLRSSKAKLPGVTDSSNAVPNFPILSTCSSHNIDTDKTCNVTEPKGNKVRKHDSEMDLFPLPSNNETVEDVCKAVSSSSSSEVSSVSSTQQLLKPKPVTARTYSRDMRKSFHGSFVKNWAETLPDKNTTASNSINQPKGLTTKEKIYTKKQKRQPTRLKDEVTNESNFFNNAETVITNSDSLHHPAEPQAMFEPPLAQVQNRKSIFKSRIQSTGNKKGALNTTLSGEMANEDPFEFRVGHTPVKPKRKIIGQQNQLTTGKSKEGVSCCKAQNKNKKMSMRKCEVAVVQGVPLGLVSVSKQESAHGSTMPSLWSTEVEEINKAGVSKAIEKHDTSSDVQKKTVHFNHDLVDVDTDVQPSQGNMSVGEANMISAEINATLALDRQTHHQCTQDEVVDAQRQMGHTGISLSHSILKISEICDLQPVEDTLNPDKNVAMNHNKANLVNESTQVQDMSVDVTLKEAPRTLRNKQKTKTQRSPDGDASCLLPESRKVSAAVQKRKFARRKKKPTCPDTETFSQKAGKELIQLIHKINEAEEYELMFSTQDAQKKLQDLHKEQVLKEAFGFASQDSYGCGFSESKVETENETSNNVTESGHTERQEIVDQADHIEQVDTQENAVSPNENHKTNSVMNRLEKTNTLERSKGLGASDIGDKPASIIIDINNVHEMPHIDIDKPGEVTHTDISTDGNDDCQANYDGEGRMNSTLLEPVELGHSHINQMLQLKSHVSLHTKQHVATTPVEAKRARVFPRPNFNMMVQVSPCAKGVLTPTKPTLISSSPTELHSSHMGAVSAKTSTTNISICEQSPMNQEGSYCDQQVNSKAQSSLTSIISSRNKVKEGHGSPGFKAMHMQSRISIDNIPDRDSTVSSTCANKDVDSKFPMRTKTRITNTVNTTQLSLKSKNTEAAFVPSGRNSERAANDALGCDVILALDTCMYSSSCRTTSDGNKDVEEEAGVILETLDLDTHLQHTNDVHSQHIVLSQHSPLMSHGFDHKSTLTAVTATNRTNEEAIAESQNVTTCSTQGPVMFPQDSVHTQNMHEEFSSNCWIDPKKDKMAYPDTAALINLSSDEEEKKKNVTQSAVIVVTSQETSSGCSSLSQSILHPTGANDLRKIHKNDISHSGNNICSWFQKPSVDKSTSAYDNQAKPLCLAAPETPNSRSSPKNKISSAPCRITCSESEDEDYMLIVRRRKRKSFSLDGSPVKPLVFGCEQKLLEEELAPGTKNDECDVDMIGETEAMRAIDTWTQQGLEDNSGARMSDSCVSESLQCQQEGTLYLNVLRGTEEDASNTGQTVHKISSELLELPTGKLQCIDPSRKFVSSLNDVNCDPFSKPKSPKRLFSPTSETRLTRLKTNKQHENNCSDHRNGIAVIKVNDSVNECNDQNKLSENVEIYVPETNVMSQDDDDNSHNSSNNSITNLLIDTGLDISLSENPTETSATNSRTVSCDPKKGKQTKRGLAKTGYLNLDTSVKHPNSLLSPAAKALVRSGVEKLTNQRIVHESDDVILLDTEEEDNVGVTGQNRIQAEAIPGGSRKCDSDVEIADSGNISRTQQKVKKLPVETKMRKPKVKVIENKYCDAKKQLEKELFGVDSKQKLSSEEDKDRNQEMPADHTRNAFAKDVEKAGHTCAGVVDDQGDDDLLFDLGDSSDDEVLSDGHVKNNARSVENQNQKSDVVGQLDDSVCMAGSPPVTSSPMEAGNCLEQETVDQSVITTVDETDIDDEDSMCLRPKSRVKRLQIVSDSEDSNQEAIPVHNSTNCSSLSALSSQSEILNTEQQEALEEDVAKLHQQIAEYEAKLGQENADFSLTPATQEERACSEASTDVALISDDADEDSDDLFVSPLSPSPPPRQPSIKSVPKRPAHSKPNRQTDLYIKQFQSPGGTVRTKKSLEFAISTASSHSQGNNITKTHLLETRPLGGNKESNIKNILQKQSSDRVLHDITHKSLVSHDADTRDEVIDVVESSEDRLALSPVILSQRSRQIVSESDKREVTGSVTSRFLKYPPEKDVCLVASALGREEYLLVMKLAEKYGLKLTSKFSTEVTHVVMKPATGYDRVCDRTLKFFQGVAYKCWVVAFPWVLDSLQTGSLLPEEDYEIVGDTSGGENTFGVKHSRLSREHLFTDFCLACVGDSSEMPKESLRELLTVCGASVVDDPIGLLSKVARYKIIVRCSDSDIAPTTAELDMFNGLYKHMGLLTVMREWVLDSLGSYKLQPLIEYVLNTGVTSVPF